MTIVKKGTKKAYQLLETARHNEGFFLYEVYKTASDAKANAWERCLILCEKENGINFHICSHNAQCFTVAWEVENGVRIETAYSSYLVEC